MAKVPLLIFGGPDQEIKGNEGELTLSSCRENAGAAADSVKRRKDTEYDREHEDGFECLFEHCIYSLIHG